MTGKTQRKESKMKGKWSNMFDSFPDENSDAVIGAIIVWSSHPNAKSTLFLANYTPVLGWRYGNGEEAIPLEVLSDSLWNYLPELPSDKEMSAR